MNQTYEEEMMLRHRKAEKLRDYASNSSLSPALCAGE